MPSEPTTAGNGIATSSDRRSHRPTKKRRALSPTSAQSQHVTSLFARPDQTINLPSGDGGKRKAAHAAPPPPDIVSNVQGSSAGAGSGEFHVYKAARRREYARLRAMDAELAVEAEAADFEAARREREARDEERTRKNREKRDKKKKGRAKQKNHDDADGPAGAEAQVARNMDISGDGDEDGDETGAPASTASLAPETGLLIHDDD